MMQYNYHLDKYHEAIPSKGLIRMPTFVAGPNTSYRYRLFEAWSRWISSLGFSVDLLTRLIRFCYMLFVKITKGNIIFHLYKNSFKESINSRTKILLVFSLVQIIYSLKS